MSLWKDEILFVVFVPRKDKKGQDIENFFDKLEILIDKIKTQVKGTTKLKTASAIGDTLGWGREETDLLLVLTQPETRENLEYEMQDIATSIVDEFNQESVLIVQQGVRVLFVSREAI